MSAKFNIAYELTRNIEAGYSNRANDLGGETYAGITRKNWPRWDGWNEIDRAKTDIDFPQSINHKYLERSVSLFYRVNFWEKIRGDHFDSQIVANQVYDAAVNSGIKQSGKHLQRALNLLNRQQRDYGDVEVDGKIGNKTLTAMQVYLSTRNLGEYLLAFYLLVQIGGLWVRLASERPDQEDNMNGWGKRGILAAYEIAEHYNRINQ